MGAAVHPPARRANTPMPTPLHARSLALALGVLAGPALALDRIEFSFNDPSAQYSAYYADIQRVAAAAGNSWLDHFLDSAAPLSLGVQINFASIATATGRSAASAYLGDTVSGQRLFAQGAAYEINTGIDSNGAAMDIELTLGVDGYLQNELWFDPNPSLRAAPVPSNQTDAYSVLQHEFGHALGFNGWRDSTTGALPGDYLSTFDALITVHTSPSGTTVLHFNGAQSMASYGGPVPLTLDNYGHFGNWASTLGADLVPDLMNGLGLQRGARYAISALDLHVMRDLGLSSVSVSAVPEPGTWLLWLGGLCALAASQRGAGLRLIARTAGSA